jgi:hypothetical protein
MDQPLDGFITACRGVVAETADAADRVTAIAPLMLGLLQKGAAFLHPEHYREDPAHYAQRDLSRRGTVALRPGLAAGEMAPGARPWQLGRRRRARGPAGGAAYMSADGEIYGDSEIRLRRGWVVLLYPGAVTTFMPNPDHIHMTGVATERPRCVSLHQYGRNMDCLHVYDVPAGTRKLINVLHYQSRHGHRLEIRQLVSTLHHVAQSSSKTSLEAQNLSRRSAFFGGPGCQAVES